MNIDNKLVYGFLGMLVIIVLVIVLMPRKKESFSDGAVTNTMTLVTDTDGNLSTTYSVPIGAIMLWSGNASSVPKGWRICNGDNNTPNLGERVVIGAGAGEVDNSGMWGGAATATFTIGADNLPSHTHGLPAECEGTKCPLIKGSLATSGSYGQYSLTTGANTGDTPNKPITINTLPPYIKLFYIMKIA